MSKNRIVNTRFWVDDYVSNLDPVEKLLFLYFLTNPATDISGVYELPIKNIALDTGIDKEMVAKILKRFSRDKKIFYINGWVGIKNFIKHQQINPKVEAGIKNGLTKAPKEILDRLSIGYDSLSHLNSNSNINSNSKLDSLSDTDVSTPTPKRFIPPTIDEVKKYCVERNNSVDAERFVDFYASKGWMVGKNKMKEWRAAIRTWEKDSTQTKPQNKEDELKKEQFRKEYFEKYGAEPLR